MGKKEQDEEMVDDCLYLYSNMCMCGDSEMVYMRDEEVWDRIVSYVRHGNESIRKHALMCAMNYIMCNNTSNIRSFVHRYIGLIDIILETLTAEKEVQEVKLLLNILELYLKCDEFDREVDSVSLGIRERFIESPYLHNLESLQSFDNTSIRYHVRCILDTYFETVRCEDEGFEV